MTSQNWVYGKYLVSRHLVSLFCLAWFSSIYRERKLIVAVFSFVCLWKDAWGSGTGSVTRVGEFAASRRETACRTANTWDSRDSSAKP